MTLSPQILRNDAHFIQTLSTQIPAIAEGRVYIVRSVGVPHVLWKVAVMSADSDGDDDPVGACIGRGGTRSRAVSEALEGAAVHFILWKEDPRAFLRNAFPSIRIDDMVLQVRNHIATLTIRTEDKGLAIGHGGINVRVASELTGWKIKFLDDPQPSSAAS